MWRISDMWRILDFLLYKTELNFEIDKQPILNTGFFERHFIIALITNDEGGLGLAEVCAF